MAISSEAIPRLRDPLSEMTLDTRGGNYIFRTVLYHRPDLYAVKARRMDASLRIQAPRLVKEFSLPSAARTSEERLFNNARASRFAIDVDAGGASHWGVQYLPRLLQSEDQPIMRQPDAAEILRDAFCKTYDEDFLSNENRPLRIVIMEELLPIETLSDAGDYAQVFFDVLNGHRRLYKQTRILHRDISVSNIMYRRDPDGAVYGVLNDMDLSSDLNDLEDSKATSLRRTGTPPFMAVDLLNTNNSAIVPRYRHDLESLFYVMLILSTRHRISPNALPGANSLFKRAAPPFNDWLTSSLTWKQLSTDKELFIFKGFPDADPIMSFEKLFPLDSTFVDFGAWIFRLSISLNRGFSARVAYSNNLAAARRFGVEFDGKEVDEGTLGGKIQYSTFFDVMKSFAGKDLRAPPVTL